MGPRLLELRKKYKLSQTALGELCGVSKAAVSQWETGFSTPEIKKLLVLRSKLIFSFDWLLTGEGEMDKSEQRHGSRRDKRDRRQINRRDRVEQDRRG